MAAMWPSLDQCQALREADRNIPREVQRHLPNLENQTRLMKKSSKFACWVALLKSYLPSSFSCQVWQISMRLSCYFYNSLPSGFSKATYICSSLCCILRGCPTSTVYSIKLRTNSQSLLTSSTEQKTMSYPQRPTNWGKKKIMSTNLQCAFLWTTIVYLGWNRKIIKGKTFNAVPMTKEIGTLQFWGKPPRPYVSRKKNK